MNSSAYDVIVVGGGPAGASCATLLGRRGRSVLLLDRASFPRPKLCTHAIMPAGLPVLNELGVLERLEAAGAQRWYGIRLSLNGRVFEEPLPSWKAAYPYGLSLRRDQLDDLLLSAARDQGNVEVCTSVAVSELVRRGQRIDGVLYRTEDGLDRQVGAELVVLAGGRRTALVRGAGLKTVALPNRHTAYVAYIAGIPAEQRPALEGYYWHGRAASLLPADNGLRIGGVMAPPGSWDPSSSAERLLTELRQFPSLHPRLKNARVITVPVPVRGLKNVWRGPVAPGVLALGDAGLQTDPLFGQGISWALRGAARAAACIDDGLRADNLAGALGRYGRERALTFGPRFAGMGFVSAIQPGSMLERLLVANANVNPASTALFLRLILGFATVSREAGSRRTLATWVREALTGGCETLACDCSAGERQRPP